MDFKVDKGIEIPKRQRRGQRMNYPFESMEVGDSFEAPLADKNKIRPAASGYGKRHGKKFVTRETDAGTIRCWRTE